MPKNSDWLQKEILVVLGARMVDAITIFFKVKLDVEAIMT